MQIIVHKILTFYYSYSFYYIVYFIGLILHSCGNKHLFENYYVITFIYFVSQHKPFPAAKIGEGEGMIDQRIVCC